MRNLRKEGETKEMTLEKLQTIFPSATAETWHQHANGSGWVQNTANVAPTAYIGIDCIVFDNAKVFGNAKVFDNAWVFDNAKISGDAWVSGDARVFGDAWVSGDSRVFGDALVFGNAKVSGDAQISEDAWVFGNAWVFDNAKVLGNAQISGNARVFGDAWVFGNARIFDNALVFGNARIFDNARISGGSWVSGNARIFGGAQISGGAWEFSPLQIQGTGHFVVVCAYGKLAIGCMVHDVEWWKEHYRGVGRSEGYTKQQIAEYRNYIELARVWMKIHGVDGHGVDKVSGDEEKQNGTIQTEPE